MSAITRRFLSSATISKSVCGCLNSTRSLSSSSAIIKNPSYSHPSELISLPQQYLRPLGVRLFCSDLAPGFPKTNGRRKEFSWGIRIVPEEEAHVIERFGKFQKILGSGLHFLVPGVDQIAYIHTLKEQYIHIPNQSAVTSDDVSLKIKGVIFLKVLDPVKSSYNVEDPSFAVTQLAQTSLQSAIGNMTLDETFRDRGTLNTMILEAMNDVVSNWGLQCLRYVIRDITPPPKIRQIMEMQAKAKLTKRADILMSEGTADTHRSVAKILEQHDDKCDFKKSRMAFFPSSISEPARMWRSLYKNALRPKLGKASMLRMKSRVVYY